MSEECRTKTISDEICSVGAGLQCQCQYPQVAGHDNICFDGKLSYIYNIVLLKCNVVFGISTVLHVQYKDVDNMKKLKYA